MPGQTIAEAMGVSFLDLEIRPLYSGADDPLHEFYVPLLSRAVSYDRLVGYYSSRELALAARGVAPFVARHGRMRLIVGAQLTAGDIHALTRGQPLEDALVSRLLADPLGEGVSIVEREYLRLLAWLVKQGQLEIKVGVPLDDQGRPLPATSTRRYFHSKYGVLTDAMGERVAFLGSNNETAAGWQENHETFTAYRSWSPYVWAEYGKPIVERFADHWLDRPDAGWTVLSLPQAVRDELIKLVPGGWQPRSEDPGQRDDGGQVTLPHPRAAADPPQPPEPDLAAARAELASLAAAPTVDGGTGVGLVTAGVEPLPHQLRIAHRAITSYPRGYLLADEVGLGKTIEAGLILRELLLSQKARTALILVPASVLRQWQEELHEKLALDIPRYDQGRFWDRHGEPIPYEPGTNPWAAFPVVLASSHLARRRDRRRELFEAGPWDIVFVDEAHHARRRGSRPDASPNALLSLLQEMKERRLWQTLYLASATPMQMSPHEAWDLIALFGLPGAWGYSAAEFQRYYANLQNEADKRDWIFLHKLLADYFVKGDPATRRDARLEQRIKDQLGFAKAGAVTKMHTRPLTQNTVRHWSDGQTTAAGEWLSTHTPMRDRVFRTTRQTLHRYQELGILSADVVIPRRDVNDRFIPMTTAEEGLYQRIDDYIRRHYNAYQVDQSNQALGFIMTVYRRRLTSSFHAIRASLQRRLDALSRGAMLQALLDDDDRLTTEDDTLFEVANLDVRGELLGAELAELRSFIEDLDHRRGDDSKLKQLIKDLDETWSTYDSVVIFTQYTDTMDFLRDHLAAVYGRIATYSGRGGEVYDPASETWRTISKAELKTRFREKEVRVLIGTDSMSEGLNLQTCGRLINYDVPWNLMRVEQRIGRVDRINASYPVVSISNYFYADTVEQRVYEGIKGDFGDFVHIVGDAQPVLAATEEAIRSAAMSEPGHQQDEITRQVNALHDQVALATSSPVRLSDLEDLDPEEPPEVEPATSLEEMREILTRNPLTGPRLTPVEEQRGVYALSLDSACSVITFPIAEEEVPLLGPELRYVSFDRAVVEKADTEIELLTYGAPALQALLLSAANESKAVG
ncbi:SNF2-related protein [Streptomyces sp. NPDC051211]|uniref:SNF2-related protein n=1 Tax=Streptomyces sp. NPDC051211 TaxID=3154643 RepID=UPI003450E87B